MFFGKKSEFAFWENKFKAKARRKGYLDILRGNVEVLNDEKFEKLKGNETNCAELKEARELNELAFEDLVLSMDTKKGPGRIAANLVNSAKNGDFSEGDAKEAWDKLRKKCNPSTTPSLLRIKKEFNKSVLKLEKDPAECVSLHSSFACFSSIHIFTQAPKTKGIWSHLSLN